MTVGTGTSSQGGAGIAGAVSTETDGGGGGGEAGRDSNRTAVVGDRVMLKHLADDDLNGQEATVVQQHDDGRLTVKPDNRPGAIKVKQRHVVLVPRSQSVGGSASRPSPINTLIGSVLKGSISSVPLRKTGRKNEFGRLEISPRPSLLGPVADLTTLYPPPRVIFRSSKRLGTGEAGNCGAA